MRREIAVALVACLSAASASAQQISPAIPPPGVITGAQSAEAAPSPDATSGLYKIGGRISAPVVRHQVIAEFSEEARRANYQGFCLISLIVDAQGRPQNIRVVRALGMGLDEKAAEAVRQYKFKPAMMDGTTPVPVQITIKVDFKLNDVETPDLSGLPVQLPSAGTAAPAPAQASDQAARQIAYYAGPGVIAPDLMPKSLDEMPTGHCKELDGTAELSAIVDAKGVTHFVTLIKGIGNNLDEVAIQVVAADRFTPGSRDGVPAAVVISDKISLSGCLDREKNKAGRKSYYVHLRSVPGQKIELQQPPYEDATMAYDESPPRPASDLDQRVGDRVTPPVVVKSVEAQYSDEARRKKIEGVALISLIVDVHGKPQSVRVARSLEPGLDEKAVEAIKQYRFTPAKKRDGTPVPVMITIEVDFHLF